MPNAFAIIQHPNEADASGKRNFNFRCSRNESPASPKTFRSIPNKQEQIVLNPLNPSNIAPAYRQGSETLKPFTGQVTQRESLKRQQELWYNTNTSPNRSLSL